MCRILLVFIQQGREESARDLKCGGLMNEINADVFFCFTRKTPKTSNAKNSRDGTRRHNENNWQYIIGGLVVNSPTGT